MRRASASMLFALVALLMASGHAKAQGAGPALTLIAPEGLAGWSAPGASSKCLANVSGTLNVSQCAGWLRTEKPVYGDYVVTFELRARVPETRVFLGLLGSSSKEGRPEYFVGLPLLGPAAASPESVQRFDMLAISETARAQAMKPEREWQTYVVTRNRQGVHVLLNGTQILSSGPIRASDGWIGFTADQGAFELRAVALRHLMPPPSAGSGVGAVRIPGELADGAYRLGPGISPPKLVHEERPSYPPDALAARIEGAVMIECVVDTDGTVGKATVIRSLDDRYGLDDEALKAARRWRFRPGTRNGVAVPVWITIQLSFTLRK
jgi:TonB family protein